MTLEETHVEIATHCGEIAKLFRPGAKVTVIVRNPGRGKNHSADMLVGDDDWSEVVDAITVLTATRPERKIGDSAPGTSPAHTSPEDADGR